MSRISPQFTPLGHFLYTQTHTDHVTLAFENGFVHIRSFANEALQVQITKTEKPDFRSYALEDKLETTAPSTEISDTHIGIGIKSRIIFNRETAQWHFEYNSSIQLSSERGLGFGFLGEKTLACFHLENDRRFFGLGEKTGNLNRRGKAFVNWNTDAFGYNDGTDPLYVSIPFFLTTHKAACLGILADNSFRSRFNFGASNKRMFQIGVEYSVLNLIIIPGAHPADVLSRYHHLTGPMPMPPRWALGLHQCRYSYYPDSRLLALADQFRWKKIPCDVIYLDIHYMDAYKVFTSDPEKFPNLKSLSQELNKKGFRLVAIQDPGIKVEPGYQPYESGKEGAHFLRYPDGEDWHADVWPGTCAFPDFTAEKTRTWWARQTQKWAADTGMGGLWNDMNEPATWGQDVPDLIEFDLDGRGGNHLEARNVYGQQMAKATREGLTLARKDERPFVLTRAGFAGIHRYAAVWSGDNVANEEHLFLGIRIMLSLAMSGVSFNGPDVGGFVGDSGRNLFVRWISVASFFPFFRLHSMIDSRDNEPWSYGELAEAIATNYIRLRYKLLPTLYSCFKSSSKTGLPVVRPYFWSRTDLEFDLRFQHQFFLGQNLLILPAASDQQVVWAQVPAGDWFHLFNGSRFSGESELYMPAPLDELAVMVKSGAILITRPPGLFADDPEADHFHIHLFYGDGFSTEFVYDDDGKSENPQLESFLEGDLSFNYENGHLQFKRTAGQKPFPIKAIYLWHFPEANRTVTIENKAYTATPAHFEWLAALPNFDPFEDKSKTYYSNCHAIYFAQPFSL